MWVGPVGVVDQGCLLWVWFEMKIKIRMDIHSWNGWHGWGGRKYSGFVVWISVGYWWGWIGCVYCVYFRDWMKHLGCSLWIWVRVTGYIECVYRGRLCECELCWRKCWGYGCEYRWGWRWYLGILCVLGPWVSVSNNSHFLSKYCWRVTHYIDTLYCYKICIFR